GRCNRHGASWLAALSVWLSDHGEVTPPAGSTGGCRARCLRLETAIDRVDRVHAPAIGRHAWLTGRETEQQRPREAARKITNCAGQVARLLFAVFVAVFDACVRFWARIGGR